MAAAAGLAGRTTTAILPVPLAAVRIKHPSANTASALTASHGILNPLLKGKDTGDLGRLSQEGGSYQLIHRTNKRKKKAAQKERKLLLLNSLT
ncbi:MAG: hypothetical protein A3C47_06715 [Omnitrophica bacterium RIFCSPHIGHO2_02_FULL_51_18]|nr:MAG: hypothetical protein A3C47_06715 [Omnitrophica bacterium RIFCSPHIGHO2_02_FULL_51_18]